MSASTPGRSSHAHAQVVAGLHLAHRQDRRRRTAGRAGTRGAARGAPGRRCACASRRRGRRPPRSPSARRPRRRRSTCVAPTASPFTSTAFITPSTLAIRRCAGISVGCTRSSMPSARPPRDAEQLDPVAELLGVADVLLRELRDALGVGLVELHRDAEGDRRHDGELVRGVDALDVERRVGLGVAALLRLLQHRGERQRPCRASPRG